MKVIADLHLHSRFSRAVSSSMTIPVISEWAKKKGIKLVATGDWTHPIWYRELKAGLVEKSQGLYKTKDSSDNDPYFVLSTELSSIYSQGGITRRIHFLVLAPNLGVAEKVNQQLSKRGVNLLSDGRPIMGLSAKDVVQIVLETDSNCIIIPAHIWTPWFSLYGSKSGFDSINECFGDLSKYIFAVETGLSSDPAMNWRVEDLMSRRIVSFSDAHSPTKLGREATVFELEEYSYENLRKALTQTSAVDSKSSGNRISHTIEFYPEEGKYHYTGHRKCGVVYSPNEARKKGTICPVCGRQLTGGVLSRVETLATQDAEVEIEVDSYGVQWVKLGGTSLRRGHLSQRPYTMLVPLIEIIAESLGVGVGSKKVSDVYEHLISTLGPEFKVLLESRLDKIEKITDPKIAQGIKKVRSGDIVIEPGYDGVFGKVKIWKDEKRVGVNKLSNQSTLF